MAFVNGIEISGDYNGFFHFSFFVSGFRFCVALFGCALGKVSGFKFQVVMRTVWLSLESNWLID
jgi:hypothetical protein